MSFYAPKENKYPQIPDRIIDLHGFTTSESKEIIDELLADQKISHLRLIVGKGLNSQAGPILPNFVKTYLNSKGISFRPAKIQDGGEGALEVFL